MTKTIYVPQGYCARLTSATIGYGIGGLYTDRFSTCNILACISDNKIILVHVDYPTLMFWNEQLKREIEQIENIKEIVIVSRENEVLLKDPLIKFIGSFGLASKITEKEIDINHDGIYISFNSQNSSILHPNIKLYPIGSREGLNLIHHPQEQQIEAVQKSYQIIGMKAKYITKKIPVKSFSIFDGRAWEPMDDVEVKIDTSHPATLNEMQFITKDDPLILIAGKLGGITESMEDIAQFAASPKDLGMQVAFYLEGYLNNYDFILLFKRNLKEMINSDFNIPENRNDLEFKEKLNNILSEEQDAFFEVQDLCNSYKITAPDTEFKKNVVSEIITFSAHYQERKYYHDLKQRYNEIQEASTQFNEQGVKYYKENNFQNAAELFFKAIQLYTYCSLKNDPKLASLYYNCGRSQQQLGEYKAASILLNTSLILRENYIDPKPRSDIEKTKKALEECQKASRQNSSWVESLTPITNTHISRS